MVNCAVPNCQSGYSFNKRHKINEKVHYFKVPKIFLEEFRKATNNPNLKEKHCICHKHFLPSDINWKQEVLDPSGNVMASRTLLSPRLKIGRIPTQLLNLEYPPRRIKKFKSSLNKTFVDNEKSKQKNVKVNQAEQDDSSSDFSSDSSFEEALLSEVQRNGRVHSDEEKFELFESYFSNEMAFNIPKSWCRCDINENDFQAITFMQMTGRIRNNIVSTICRKKLVLYKDLTVHPFVMDIPMEIEKLNFTSKFVNCTKDIDCIVNDFDKLRICEGTNIFSPILDLENSFAFRDSAGQLRHHYCTLILPSNIQIKHCLPCNKAKVFLSRKIASLKSAQ